MSHRLASLPDPYPVPTASGPVTGRVTLPGSKSITNRALMIAALANGPSILHGVLDSDDTRYMVGALETLGFSVQADWDGRTVEIEGLGGRIPAQEAELFLGNSGTSMRFLTALCAIGNGRFLLDGTEAMRLRPIGPLLDALRQLGVDARSVNGDDCPPIEIRTKGFEPGTVRVPGNLSSQYFSALAMVLPATPGDYRIEVEGDLVSKPYIDLTASTLRAFGVEMKHDNYQAIWVEPNQTYQGRTYTIEPDASAASYFYALAAVSGGSITVEALPPSSKQGDIHFVDVLERMGCRVDRNQEITVYGTDQLRGIDCDMNAISDTVMSLAAIAPFADGPTTMSNIGHIRLKETDRLAATCAELGRMGIQVEERADSLTIQPGKPQPATIQTYDDHRMAMAFAITGTQAAGIKIADPACVSKTLPEFWEILERLVGLSG
ncbi:MAG: 3-phosphoshikimate 1-carboxyvinyltransferase [Thermomicrobiales bacterium]